MRKNYTPPEIPKTKRADIPNAGKGMEQLELSSMINTFLVRTQQCHFWVYAQHK